MTQPHHLAIGQVGENIAAEYLARRGLRLIERNYRQKWGELDLVCEKGRVVHFVEVKTVSRELSLTHIPREYMLDPADNMHPGKLKRLARVIQTYLLGHFPDQEPDWQLDLVCVYLDMSLKKAHVELVEDIDL